MMRTDPCGSVGDLVPVCAAEQWIWCDALTLRAGVRGQ